MQLPEMIYISAPYSSKEYSRVLENLERSMDYWYRIKELGHFPVNPLWGHYQDLFNQANYGRKILWQEWIEYDLRILERCDAIFILAASPGTQLEEQHAREKGLKIYRHINLIKKASPARMKQESEFTQHPKMKDFM